MPWFVYIVRCRDGSLYTGATNDLDKRVRAHNAGKGARYTRSRRPVELVFSRRARQAFGASPGVPDQATDARRKAGPHESRA